MVTNLLHMRFGKWSVFLKKNSEVLFEKIIVIERKKSICPRFLKSIQERLDFVIRSKDSLTMIYIFKIIIIRFKVAQFVSYFHLFWVNIY